MSNAPFNILHGFELCGAVVGICVFLFCALVFDELSKWIKILFGSLLVATFFVLLFILGALS